MAKATSISADSLSKLTREAVKAATQGVPGKFSGKGPTMGYILQKDLGNDRALALATEITNGLQVNARGAGVSGLRLKPVVVIRPGLITAGYILDEIGIQVR